MLKFTDRDQHYPDLRDAKIRRGDFSEIYEAFQPARAAEQAERCSQCGIPFCQVHCPLQNNIPDWLKLTAEGRLKEAYDAASATNTFPEICGRICPQDRLCEGNCVIERNFDSVTIGAVEKYITDTAWQEGWVQPFAPAHESGLSVGIVGAGPAGLAAAEQLRRKGHAVHVYDRYDRTGGLLIYGIPNFKLDKSIVQKRREQFEASGVQFHLNTAVGRDVTLAQLQEKHDAVLVATGVYQAKHAKLPGHDLKNVIPAMEFLTASNRRNLGDAVSAETAEGKRVVVIGGGDTAMDCVRTAVRQNAASVICLYRRDRENMPGSRREVKYAEEEGVQFHFLSAPVAFNGKNDAVTQVMTQPMRLSAPDASGRRKPEPLIDTVHALDADLVILALGFDAEDLPLAFNAPELRVSESGTLAVDAAGMTSLPGVFAAGDIVRGASLVVWAIRDGRDVAAEMHRYLLAAKQVAA